ncbi:MAG: ABC transporter ATP-binding protein [Chloroflexota bacterium]
MTNAIWTSGLVKTFGTVHALDGLNLTIKTGEIHGFLGPNGAGKTTTIRTLLGLLRADSGEVQLLGGDPWHDAVELHKRLAYVPGDVTLWPGLTGGEVIDLLGRMRGNFDTQRRDHFIQRFDLDPTKKCRIYSKGNRQKVALIAALASDVELYIFDEPSSGLDPLMKAIFQNCVTEIKKQGKTVFLSSHILAEVEALCDRVSIIREGKIVEAGSLSDLRHMTRNSITVETRQAITGLYQISGVYNLHQDTTHVKFQADPDALDRVLKHITQFGIQDLTSTPPTLAELFMQHYGDQPAVEKVMS